MPILKCFSVLVPFFLKKLRQAFLIWEYQNEVLIPGAEDGAPRW
jgi:hypothetical protein